MYKRIKYTLFTAIYVVLWLRFFLYIWDPVVMGLQADQGLAIYSSWRAAIDVVYWVGEYLMWPIYWIYYFISGLIPQSPWFPYIESTHLHQTLLDAFADVPAMRESLTTDIAYRSFVGYTDWLLVLGVVFYRLLNPLIDRAVDFIKNVVWNVLIEFSFTKRKEGKYQEALEKRAADLMKLNVQYKNLSKEAQTLAQSVITDELTKVYNKRFFLEKIAFEFKEARDKKKTLAIAMVDIDHFKKLNDNYGHLLGDKVLQAVAHIAKKGTPKDCFCCRFGGEEFAIIMPGKNKEDALAIASDIHRKLPLLRFQEDPNLTTSASMGMCIANFSDEEAKTLETYEDFIKLADDELYRAKLNGRNRIETKTIGNV